MFPGDLRESPVLKSQMRPLTIGLVGNPNSGKTTLFNQLTGLNQRVGNWPGVTVECKSGQLTTKKHEVTLVDLPGTYSLTTISPHTALDEQIACRYALSGRANLFLNVLNAAQLERNLYLTIQLLEMGVPLIVVLNMMDVAAAHGVLIDIPRLSTYLGFPVIPLIATRDPCGTALAEAIDDYVRCIPDLRVIYPPIVEAEIVKLANLVPTQPGVEARWEALQALEGDLLTQPQVDESNLGGLVAEARRYIGSQGEEDVALLIADARYQAITTLCDSVAKRQDRRAGVAEHLDRVILHRWLGIPIFLAIMYSIFFLSINLGGSLQPFFDRSSEALFIHGTQWLGHHLDLPDWLTLLLAQGIGGGLNTIIPLIPPLGLVFLFLSLLEDSGYMARAAFVMDRFMQTIGLPGKSFVPLIVGFGCNVPSIMGTRTLNTESERLLTIMIAPFMACGARMAIFVVFSATFFGRHGVLAVFSLYLLGVVVAILTAFVLKKTIIRGGATPFIMELPQYHLPHFRGLGVRIWHRLEDFVLRSGRIIILVNLLIGLLNNFSLTGQRVERGQPVSALCAVGRWVTPVLRPIGVKEENWPATVGLITGAIAKEVVLGTLNTLYTAEHLDAKSFNPDEFDLLGEFWGALQDTCQSFRGALFKESGAETGKENHCMSGTAMGVMADKFASPVAAYSYLIFVLLYMPCVSTIGAIGRESGRSWMLFSIFWGLDVAYSLATLYYQIATFSAHPGTSSATIGVVLAANICVLMAMRCMHRGRPDFRSIGANVDSTQRATEHG